MRSLTVFCFAIVLSAGCASHRADQTNARCPVMPELDIDGATFVVWNGVKVGFCCAECVERWDRMNDEMKRQALERATRSGHGL